MDQIRAMQIFQAVADARSFTQAAEHLDLPRPSVTNAVQAIEQQLGVRLLQRTTRKVSLTVEGMLYLERCRALLNDLEDINGLFVGGGRKPSGTIRVDMPARLAHLTVIPALLNVPVPVGKLTAPADRPRLTRMPPLVPAAPPWMWASVREVPLGKPVTVTAKSNVALVTFPAASFTVFAVIVAVPDPAASAPTMAGTSFAGNSTAVYVVFDVDVGADGLSSLQADTVNPSTSRARGRIRRFISNLQ